MPTEESFKNKKMILLIKIRYKKYSILQIYHRFALEMQFFGFFFCVCFLKFHFIFKKDTTRGISKFNKSLHLHPLQLFEKTMILSAPRPKH